MTETRSATCNETQQGPLVPETSQSVWKKGLPIFLVCLVGSLLAFSFIFGKLALGAGATPLAFLCVSLCVAGAILWIFSLLKGQAAQPTKRIVEYGIIAGLLFVLPNMIAFMAIKHVGAGFVSMTYLFPLLITYCLAILIRYEQFVLMRAVAVLIGLSGGVLLAASKASLGEAAIGWILLTFCGPIIIAVGNLYRTLRWPQGVAPLFLASQMLMAAGVFLIPVVYLLEGAASLVQVFGGTTAPLLVAQILTFSALYFFFFILQSVAGPIYLSQIGSVAAVVGAVIASHWLGEHLPPNLPLAAILVAIGIILFQWTGLRRDKTG